MLAQNKLKYTHTMAAQEDTGHTASEFIYLNLLLLNKAEVVSENLKSRLGSGFVRDRIAAANQSVPEYH